MSILCSQCGAAAERCERCAAALCTRRLCQELHEASCAAVSTLPAGPAIAPTRTYPYGPTKAAPRHRERNPEVERLLAEQLVVTISRHRQTGRSALIAGDLDTAFDELWAARQIEPDLDRLGAVARSVLPTDWEIETDLTPLARALSARAHPRAGDTWRRLLEDRPARSIQAEAAEWLARDAVTRGHHRQGLRALHAASLLGRPTPPQAFHTLYRQAGVDPAGAFGLYLAASRLDPRAARAVGVRDPLTDATWPDQDARWWAQAGHRAGSELETDHQAEALGRARDLAGTKRDHGWLMLAEGDHAAGPRGVRTLGRSVRSGSSEPADDDAFVRIRLAYEGAAVRLPDVAWPWYRLAELLAWAGFTARAVEHLAQAERRSLGGRSADQLLRPLLRALVHAGMGDGPDGLPTAARPFPAEPFGVRFSWRLRLR